MIELDLSLLFVCFLVEFIVVHKMLKYKIRTIFLILEDRGGARPAEMMWKDSKVLVFPSSWRRSCQVVNTDKAILGCVDRNKQDGPTFLRQRHKILCSNRADFKFRTLKHHKLEEGNHRGRTCENWHLDKQRQELEMFRLEGGKDSWSLSFSNYLRECHMQIEVHLFCLPWWRKN